MNGYTWDFQGPPIIDVGPQGSPDDSSCLSPATVRVNGRIFLYYTGTNSRGEESICLAVSDDGKNFSKYEKNPVIKGSTPEVVYHENTFSLYFCRPAPGKGGNQIHYATSKDGYTFTSPSATPVLSLGRGKSWDSFSIETPRIFSEGGLFYMLYCGSDRYKDFPWNAGLATSRDLVRWTKYGRNPIFSRGYPGTWDESAIWYATVEKINDQYYLWYQGYGGGMKRDERYSSFLNGGKSQVGTATLDAPYFFVKPRKEKQ